MLWVLHQRFIICNTIFEYYIARRFRTQLCYRKYWIIKNNSSTTFRDLIGFILTEYSNSLRISKLFISILSCEFYVQERYTDYKTWTAPKHTYLIPVRKRFHIRSFSLHTYETDQLPYINFKNMSFVVHHCNKCYSVEPGSPWKNIYKNIKFLTWTMSI